MSQPKHFEKRKDICELFKRTHLVLRKARMNPCVPL
jgi:hypothetical protein